MDSLYIKIENGQPVGYPFFLDNLLQCGTDPRNNPEWRPFVRQSTNGFHSVLKKAEYEFFIEGDIVTEKLVFRDLTPEEVTYANNSLLEVSGSVPDAFE